jgi:hypothetical protein
MTMSENWPMLQIPACTFGDEDVAFHSDITYFRLLLDDIWEAAYFGTRQAKPLPITLTDELSALCGSMHICFTAAVNELKAVTW